MHSSFTSLVSSKKVVKTFPFSGVLRPFISAGKTMEPRREVIDELFDAVMLGLAPIHSGAGGLATMEVCLAILQSAAEGREVQMRHQCGVRG